jgi:hypothetical protein
MPFDPPPYIYWVGVSAGERGEIAGGPRRKVQRAGSALVQDLTASPPIGRTKRGDHIRKWGPCETRGRRVKSL